MAFVIIGYGLASLTNMASNVIWQPLKVIFLLYSVVKLIGYYQNDRHLKNLYIFTILVLLTIPFSISPLNSIKRVFVMLLPMIYVATSLRALFLQYTWQVILFALLKSFRWIYALPFFSFIILGGDLGESDFYGEIVGAFVSNHYGWGAFMFISSQLVLIQYNQSKFYSFWSLIAIFYFILLLYSGSRSGLLSLAITFGLWFFNRSVSPIFKIALSVVLIGVILINLSSESALKQRIEKTENQYEGNSENTDDDYYTNSATLVDARAVTRSIGNLAFINNPILFVTGMGIFQFKEGLNIYAPWAEPLYYESGVHNSYGEIYFGCGILVFMYFLWYLTIKPVWIYLKYLRHIYKGFFGMVIIIPFFESNITAGQFIFYPWFISVFFMLYVQDQLLNSLEIEK
jgi:hypothetical protein